MNSNEAQTPLVIDAHLPRHGSRRLRDVAAAILRRDDGRVLLTSRPPGKDYAGYWELPGGKLENEESVEQALVRELREELGLTVAPEDVRPWRTLLADYPHTFVRLHFCFVTAWQGELHMHEGQHSTWAPQPVAVRPVLPATAPALRWLEQAPPAA
ncbi:MAG: NUDIX domain-containing protein [Ottowia sp.]|nr:NUDIX domain-containing protein [Ottowia sp.]